MKVPLTPLHDALALRFQQQRRGTHFLRGGPRGFSSPSRVTTFTPSYAPLPHTQTPSEASTEVLEKMQTEPRLSLPWVQTPAAPPPGAAEWKTLNGVL